MTSGIGNLAKESRANRPRRAGDHACISFRQTRISELKESFASHGVTPDRVSLIGSTSREEHSAAYRLIDIGLDPFPYGGGVSTWEGCRW